MQEFHLSVLNASEIACRVIWAFSSGISSWGLWYQRKLPGFSRRLSNRKYIRILDSLLSTVNWATTDHVFKLAPPCSGAISDSMMLILCNVLPSLLKFSTAFWLPRIYWVSTKYFPSEWNPWSLRSSIGAGIILQASLLSILDTFAFFPPSWITYDTLCADNIVIVSTDSCSMLSLNKRPLGKETSRTILTFSPGRQPSNGFNLKFGRGGCTKGPDTNWLFIQMGTVSTTASPNVTIDGAFLWKQGGSGFFWSELLPLSKESMHFFALCIWAHVRLCFSFEIFNFSTEMSIHVFGVSGSLFFWKKFQKLRYGGT